MGPYVTNDETWNIRTLYLTQRYCWVLCNFNLLAKSTTAHLSLNIIGHVVSRRQGHTKYILNVFRVNLCWKQVSLWYLLSCDTIFYNIPENGCLLWRCFYACHRLHNSHDLRILVIAHLYGPAHPQERPRLLMDGCFIEIPVLIRLPIKAEKLLSGHWHNQLWLQSCPSPRMIAN